MKINKKDYYLLLVLFVAEAFSFAGYFLPDLRQIVFVLLSIAVLVLTLQKFEYGILIMLSELIIGSKGYLFYLEVEGIQLSIRIIIWLIY